MKRIKLDTIFLQQLYNNPRYQDVSVKLKGDTSDGLTWELITYSHLSFVEIFFFFFLGENVVTVTLLKKWKKTKKFLIFSPFFIEKLISLTLAWPFGFDSKKVSFSFSKVYRTRLVQIFFLVYFSIKIYFFYFT